MISFITAFFIPLAFLSPPLLWVYEYTLPRMRGPQNFTSFADNLFIITIVIRTFWIVAIVEQCNVLDSIFNDSSSDSPSWDEKHIRNIFPFETKRTKLQNYIHTYVQFRSSPQSSVYCRVCRKMLCILCVMSICPVLKMLYIGLHVYIKHYLYH